MQIDPASATALAATAANSAQGIVRTLFGPAAEQVGLILAESVGAYRHRNLANIVLKAKEKLDAVGLPVRSVPLKIIHPMLEAASLEEEPTLQDLWASMLANAASDGSGVLPSFPEILRQMTGVDAKLLCEFAKQNDGECLLGFGRPSAVEIEKSATRPKPRSSPAWRAFLDAGVAVDPGTTKPGEAGMRMAGADLQNYQVSLGNLLRLGLLVREVRASGKVRIAFAGPSDREDAGSGMDHEEEIVVSVLGRQFLTACQTPPPIGQRDCVSPSR